MTDELIKQLRRNERTAMTPWARDDFKMAADLIEQQAAQIAALEAKVASGGDRDAERYRFARDNIMEGHELPGGLYLSDEPGADWDRTIDAAIDSEKKS